jgi:hypothetical protein
MVVCVRSSSKLASTGSMLIAAIPVWDCCAQIRFQRSDGI